MAAPGLAFGARCSSLQPGLGAQAREVRCEAQASKLSWTRAGPVQGQRGWTAEAQRGGSSSGEGHRGVLLLLKGIWWGAEALLCDGEVVICCVGGETRVARACLTPGQRRRSCWSLGMQGLELAEAWL